MSRHADSELYKNADKTKQRLIAWYTKSRLRLTLWIIVWRISLINYKMAGFIENRTSLKYFLQKDFSYV